MDEHALRRLLEGGGGLAGRLVRACLWLPGQAYGGAMRLRRFGYARGWCRSVVPPAPVISVGNLTAGGSGKTPFVLFLVRELQAAGHKPAILLRGYHAQSGHSDEAALYRRLNPDVIVEVDSNRAAGAARAVAAGADVLVLDDGFQHLRLRRAMDIVLVDATSPWGGGNTLPGGLLREPRSALLAADMIVVTRSDQVDADRLGRIRDEVHRLAPSPPVFTARHLPVRLARMDGTAVPLHFLVGRRVVALSGIARPESFRKTLVDAGAEVLAAIENRDHDHLDEDCLARARDLASKLAATVVLTEKDRAKKIFDVVTDNISDDINKVIQEFLVLGVDFTVDDKEGLMTRVSEFYPLHFGEMRGE